MQASAQRTSMDQLMIMHMSSAQLVQMELGPGYTYGLHNMGGLVYA